MTYTRFDRIGDTVEVIGVVPDRGLLATINTAHGHRITPMLPLTEDEWARLEAHLRFVGLEKRARRVAMAARWATQRHSWRLFTALKIRAWRG